MATCLCPLCGVVLAVPYFDGKESEELTCLTCRAGYHVRARNKEGKFHTRAADRMNKPSGEASAE